MLVPLTLAALLGTVPSVGLIWHYPFTDQGTALVAGTGVTTMTSRAAWGALEPAPGYFTFDSIQKQINVARAGGFRLILILECNTFCSPLWLRARAVSAGEMVVGPDGKQGTLPTTTSAVYHAALTEFLEKLVTFLEVADRDHTVVAYHPGIEWWFPPEYRYAQADIGRFRSWLSARYADIDAFNARWHSHFDSFTSVVPPHVAFPDIFSKGRLGLREPVLTEPWPYDLAAASADWFQFWTATSASTIDELAAEVKKLDPSRPTISFQTYAWAAAGEWDYLGWSAFMPDEVAREGAHLDQLGLQLPISWGDPYQVTVGLDLVRKYGKEIHAVDLLDFTQGQAAGLEVMRRGTHAAIAHGAAAIDYCSWAGAGDYSFFPAWSPADIRTLVTEARQALTLSGGLKPEPEAALVLPYTYPGSPNDPSSFVGFYRLMETLHVTFDLVTPRELELRTVHLSRYRWVLVPDAPDMSASATEVLAGAPKLFATSTFRGHGPTLTVVPDLGRQLAFPLRRDTVAGDGPPMLDFRSENQALRASVAKSLGSLLQAAGTLPRVSGLAGGVSCTIMAGEDSWGLYLVNGGGKAVPAQHIHVRSAAGGTISAWADLASAASTISTDGDGATIDVPAFRTSCIVRVTPKP
jgi:hypothetical protein